MQIQSSGLGDLLVIWEPCHSYLFIGNIQFLEDNDNLARVGATS